MCAFLCEFESLRMRFGERKRKIKRKRLGDGERDHVWNNHNTCLQGTSEISCSPIDRGGSAICNLQNRLQPENVNICIYIYTHSRLA